MDCTCDMKYLLSFGHHNKCPTKRVKDNKDTEDSDEIIMGDFPEESESDKQYSIKYGQPPAMPW